MHHENERTNDQVAEIHRMAVSHKYQRLGIGKLLLRSAIDFAQQQQSDYRQIVLGTSHKQQNAKKFYEKNGFQLAKSFFVFHGWIVPFYIYKFHLELDVKTDSLEK